MPTDKASLPKNWPQGFPYITTPVYSPSLQPIHRSALRTRANDINTIPSNTPKGPCALVKVTPINSSSHPANGQNGLFAAKDLKPGSFILQYLGEVHPSSPADNNASCSTDGNPSTTDPHAASNYDLSLDREHGIGIDADRRGNEARFINDYRGVAARPNAEFKEVWDESRGERGMGVWVLPEGKSGKGKGIRKGDEVLVSYGRGFWGARRDEEGG